MMSVCPLYSSTVPVLRSNNFKVSLLLHIRAKSLFGLKNLMSITSSRKRHRDDTLFKTMLFPLSLVDSR